MTDRSRYGSRPGLHAEAQAMLLEYAVGALDEAASLMAASYITIHPEARRYVSRCESYGGAIMESCCEPVKMREHSLQRVMRALDKPPRRTQKPPPPGEEPGNFPGNDRIPAPICAYIRQRRVHIKWKKFARGVEYIMLPVDGSSLQAALVRMAPGARVPRHNHKGAEMTLVLDGAFEDDDGRYGAGDLVISENAPEHQPIACGEQGCLCFIIAEHPVRYTGFRGAVLNLFIR